MFKELESIPLFQGVDERTLQLLEPLFETFSCSEGTVIFEQGEPALYLYLILEGAVEILYKPYDGPPLTITTQRSGGIVGWSAAVGNTTYTSGAVCKEDVQALRMSGRDLHKLCSREPESGRIILNLLAESVSSRWHDAQSQIQVLLNKNIKSKQKTRIQKKLRKENS